MDRTELLRQLELARKRVADAQDRVESQKRITQQLKSWNHDDAPLASIKSDIFEEELSASIAECDPLEGLLIRTGRPPSPWQGACDCLIRTSALDALCAETDQFGARRWPSCTIQGMLKKRN